MKITIKDGKVYFDGGYVGTEAEYNEQIERVLKDRVEENVKFARWFAEVVINHTMRDSTYLHLRGIYRQRIAAEDYGSASNVMGDVKIHIRAVVENCAVDLQAAKRLESLEPIIMMVVETLCARMNYELRGNTV